MCQELAHEDLIVLEREQRTRRLFDDAMVDAAMAYEPHVVTTLPVIAMALSAAGHGVAVGTGADRMAG